MFTAIVGQLMTVIASWMLERSITIGRLEYLLGSRSLGSAFISLIKLRIINILVPVILVVWCLSPLGGQASLRAVSSDVSYTNSSTDFYYLDNNNNTTPINVYASAADSYNPVIDSLFVTALASSNASKNGSQRHLYMSRVSPLTRFSTSAAPWTVRNSLSITPEPS
jgi:hypothetical protein